jgi:hypothetical protein
MWCAQLCVCVCARAGESVVVGHETQFVVALRDAKGEPLPAAVCLRVRMMMRYG